MDKFVISNKQNITQNLDENITNAKFLVLALGPKMFRAAPGRLRIKNKEIKKLYILRRFGVGLRLRINHV